ncbi:MAG: ATP-binding protein [Candidatus Hydrogenedentes bacterium]|nr:ATP-binding protein [Candidatus Hydrogenedentota bacterium]
MSAVLNLNSLEDARLWKKLQDGFVNTNQNDIAAELSGIVKAACTTAADRIKRFPYYHPEFTVHDERHLLRVTELMAMILGDGIDHLNAVEIALLILSAYFHDQGMVPESDEWEKLKESPEFLLSLERWNQDHPNVSDIRRQLEDPRFTDQEKDALSEKLQQHLDAHRTSFLRMTHGERAEQLVIRLYGAASRLSVAGVELAPYLGRLCASHAWPAARLTDENGFRPDQSIGSFSVNLRFLAVVLRVADILDFDRDRTPEPLLRTINFSSAVSFIEWSKHRSVEGWSISSERIRFTLACEHPVYQKAAYEFMDAIDHELREAHRIIDEFPRGRTPAHYVLSLPRQVERDRIEPKNNQYRYADLEFSLSRDEIVKLLMTDKLYSNNSLFVRELMQNSLDALRHRVAIYGKGQPDWEGGEISIKHFVDSDGNQVVQCVDNGIGMDELLIRNFLTNVGRSYYRSPEFAQQRVAFREKGVDFEPCSQFGIGFMSCFMFGDQILIKTRKDYGPGLGYGEPLEIEISGLGGLLVIRNGKVDQLVGTTVEITGPRKPVFLDSWADDVRLCSVVNGYALATEYRIVAETSIAEIAEKIEVPMQPAFRRTLVEVAGIEKRQVIEFCLSEEDSRLGGKIRIGLLVDDRGVPCIKNSEAHWEMRKTRPDRGLHLVKGATSTRFHGPFNESAICMDGILICGDPGREDDGDDLVGRLGSRANPIGLGDPYLVDIRGDLKPVITPSRTPPESSLGYREDPTWARVGDILRHSHAKAWCPVLEATQQGLLHLDFWRLSLIHQIPIHIMPADLLWKHIQLPAIVSELDKTSEWIPLSDIGTLEDGSYGEKDKRRIVFSVKDGRRIEFGDDVESWNVGRSSSLDLKLMRLLLRFTQISLEGNEVFLSVSKLQSPGSSDAELVLADGFRSHIFAIEYTGDASSLLSVQREFSNVNRNHPIVRYVQQFRHIPYRERTDLQQYCASVLWVLANDENMPALGMRNVNEGRQYRRLGTIFRAIDSSRYRDLAPPYSIWTKDGGIVEITHDDLIRWSEFPPDD